MKRILLPLALLALVLAAPSARAAAAVKPGTPFKIDTSSAAGAVDLTRSSAAHPTYGAAGAFDGRKNVDGRWLAVKADHMFVTYRFNTATKVTSIKLYNPDANNQTTRPPKAWTFEGSNDGDNWTVLDTRTGQTWSSGQVRSYSFQNDDAYVYYKFDCTELNGATDYLMLWEIEFWGTAPGEVPVDLTSPSGTVTTTTAGDWVKPAKNAFDNGTAHNNDDRSIHSGTTVDWIYTFDSPTKVNAYSLYSPGTAAYNYDKRMPKTWTFEAKNAEDATWTVLDTQSSETGWSALESRYYEFVNNTAYTSYRFAVTAIQSGSDSYVQIDELEFYYINDNGPLLGDMSLSRTAALAYSLSADEAANAAELSYIIDDGTAVSTNGTQAVAEGGSAIWTISGLASDTTWRISVLAENASGTDEKVAGTLFTGELALGATTSAQEYGLVPGGVVVSRGVSDPFPLTVYYTISGSDGTEGTTWAAPEPVTIPANESSAVLPVVPLLDGDVNADVTITVTLAAGNYEIPAAASAQLTLLNLAAPAGKKTWIAAADGLASDGANWTPSGAPGASDDILFDGNFSNARCTWDSAAGHAVASWTQTAAYTGTVDFDTTYDDGDFPVFAIAGDATVNGGKWTHRANAAVQTNRLSVTVGGDFTVGSGVQITASNKGYAANKFPDGSAIGVHGGSVNDITKVYGDFKHPVDIGSGGGTADMTGGGAIHIVVTGDATIDGTLAANPNQGSAQNAIGAGGSIYLQAASVAGSGSITAAGSTGDATLNDGAGGRIAVVCTTATELSFPKANFRCNGSTGGYGHSSGGGTIFVKTASQQNGTLIITHNILGITYVRWFPTKRGVTPIPVGESWALDTLEFRGCGVLCVPSGTSLSVPLSGISSASTREAGILYEGGTIDFGSAPYTLSGNWTFCADAPYTFDGDVTVQGGANLGGFKFSGHYTNDFAKCDVTVDGDLTIASGGYATVELCGPNEANATAACGGGFPMHGGQMATVAGNHCYDSVFDPAYPGHFARNGDQGNVGVGGGALKLTVTGDLVVDGRISADGTVRSKSSAAAGSVNITAKTLSGTGSITATGKPGSLQWDPGYNGVGGRVAVRVTGEDVGTTGIWTKFAARGCATNQVNTANERNQNSSAGTVYLQGASDGEKGGTIFVKNQKSYDTSNVATWLPAGTLGDEAADFKKAKLVIADRGVVAIDAPLFKLASVSIEANSRLDLHGNKVVVTDALLAGEKCPYGTFTAESSAVAGYVFDSVGGGTFLVSGRGTVLIVK